MTWIIIERDRDLPLLIGPYPDDAVAEQALEESVLIDGLCQENCLDAYTTNDEPTVLTGRGHKAELMLVDLNDPDHTGQAYTDPDYREPLVTPQQVEAMVGHALTRTQWERLSAAMPHSTFPDTIALIVESIRSGD